MQTKTIGIFLASCLFTSLLTFFGSKRLYFTPQIEKLKRVVQTTEATDKLEIMKAKEHLSFWPPNLFQQVRFNNLPSVEYEEIFDRAFLDEAKIKTKKDFHRTVMRRYQQYQNKLKKIWKVPDEKVLKVFFFMNVVSRLWGYGNPKEKQKSGCVRSNEANGHKGLTEEQMTMTAYLNSPIGCCSDYSTIMKFLLTEEKIENRIIVLGDWHIFNEVKIENEWRVADANMNQFYYQSWETMIKRPANHTIQVTVFPHANSILRNRPQNYRSEIEYYRVASIYWVLNRLSIPPTVRSEGFNIAGP